MGSFFYILYSLFFILYSIFCILYSIFFIPHSVLYILYSIFYIIYIGPLGSKVRKIFLEHRNRAERNSCCRRRYLRFISCRVFVKQNAPQAKTFDGTKHSAGKTIRRSSNPPVVARGGPSACRAPNSVFRPK